MSDVLWRRLMYMLSPQLDIYKSIKVTPYDSVLDIGCCTGLGSLQLFQEGNDVTGIDVDLDAVKFAASCIPCVDFVHADIQKPIIFGSNYDIIVMIEVLEHVQDWKAALQNAANVLFEKGQFIISARNAFADLRKNDLHEREWTALEFVEALSGYFEEVKLYDYTLANELDVTTRTTPLVAICMGPRRTK